MREAPVNLTAERSVIGTLVTFPYLWAQASELAVDDFLLPAHREIWEVFAWLVMEGQPLDIALANQRLAETGAIQKLEGGGGYLLACVEQGAPLASFDFQVAKVREYAVRRRLQATLAEALGRVGDPDAEVGALLAEVRTALTKMAAEGAEPVRFSDISPAIMDRIEDRSKRAQAGGDPVMGARTGIDRLDRLTGGLQPGWLVIIAAETGGGKTALAMQTATNVAVENGTSLAINLEMTKDDLGERALVHVGRVNSQMVRTGEIDGSCWRDLQAAEIMLAPKRLYFEDSASTFPKICAAARRWRARNPDIAGLLVVDFVQLIRSEREKGQSRAQEVGTFAQDLKSIAKELRVPVLLISQLNRQGVKADRPSRSDLKESGDLENAADLILLPWNRSNTGDDEVLLIVDKFRFGQRMDIPAQWVGRHYRFTNPAHADYHEESER